MACWRASVAASVFRDGRSPAGSVAATASDDVAEHEMVVHVIVPLLRALQTDSGRPAQILDNQEVGRLLAYFHTINIEQFLAT